MRDLASLGISPAPWRVDTRYGCVNGIIAANDDCIVETDNGVYPPEIADARLIAAAPELYEALEECERKLDACDPYCNLLGKVRAALAKAGGESEDAK